MTIMFILGSKGQFDPVLIHIKGGGECKVEGQCNPKTDLFSHIDISGT